MSDGFLTGIPGPNTSDMIPIGEPLTLAGTKITRRVGLSIRPVIEGDWPSLPEPIEYEADVLLELRDNDGNIMVEVLPDGTVNFGEHYDPDDAARRFWWGLKHILDGASQLAESGTIPPGTIHKPDLNAGESTTESRTAHGPETTT